MKRRTMIFAAAMLTASVIFSAAGNMAMAAGAKAVSAQAEDASAETDTEDLSAGSETEKEPKDEGKAEGKASDPETEKDSGNVEMTKEKASDPETEKDSGDAGMTEEAESGSETEKDTGSRGKTDDDAAADLKEADEDTSGETKPEEKTRGELQKGKALKKGDCIGIVAPAWHIDGNDFSQAVLFLQNLGYELKIADSCTDSDRGFAGNDRQRAEDINTFFADDSVDAIMCLRGGYGCARILDYLDYDLIREHPKLLIGYSDITALHVVLMERCGLVTVHGPMISSFKSIYSDHVQRLFQNIIRPDDLQEGTDSSELDVFDMDESAYANVGLEYTLKQFLEGISSNRPIGELEMPEGAALESIIPGTAQGKIIGGNLTVLASMAGTDYELQGDHNILFFEEIGERAYRIDRLLCQLCQNGLLDRVDGILIGDISNNYDDAECTVRQVIEEYAELAGKPCICGLPCGHSSDNCFLPFGVEARMTANEDGTASLVLLESALN